MPAESAPTLPGCVQCRDGAYRASWPPPQRIAVNGDGPTYLHRCGLCGTFWEFDMRFANPLPESQARQRYPAHFTDWAPSGGAAGPAQIVGGADFAPVDPLSMRDAPPDGALEEALVAVQAGKMSVAALGAPLRASRLQTPSTTLPAPDGSGMTPIALSRPPTVWVLSFTRLELARRFADDAPYCLGLVGADLLTRLPQGFGLCLNYGAQSECRLGPQDLARLDD